MKHLEKGKRRLTTIDIDQKFIQQGSSINSRGRSCTGRSTRKVREPNLRGGGGSLQVQQYYRSPIFIPKSKIQIFPLRVKFCVLFCVVFQRNCLCGYYTRGRIHCKILRSRNIGKKKLALDPV